jgi:hypothetical protein
MTRKSILKLTPAQKAVVLGDPPPEIVTNVALAKSERESAIGCFGSPFQLLAGKGPAAVKIGPLVTEITWRRVFAEMPEEGVEVLIASADEALAEAAFRANGRWLYLDGHAPKHVYAWAHMPATPRAARGKKGGAS